MVVRKYAGLQLAHRLPDDARPEKRLPIIPAWTNGKRVFAAFQDQERQQESCCYVEWQECDRDGAKKWLEIFYRHTL